MDVFLGALSRSVIEGWDRGFPEARLRVRRRRLTSELAPQPRGKGGEWAIRHSPPPGGTAAAVTNRSGNQRRSGEPADHPTRPGGAPRYGSGHASPSPHRPPRRPSRQARWLLRDGGSRLLPRPDPGDRGCSGTDDLVSDVSACTSYRGR